MMEIDLVAKLSITAAVTALVDTRIYPLVLPQAPTLPALVYQRLSARHLHDQDGISGYAVASMQITCYALTFAEAMSLSEAVRLALSGFIGTVGTTNFAIYLADSRHIYEPEPPPTYRIDLDFEVQYNEPQT